MLSWLSRLNSAGSCNAFSSRVFGTSAVSNQAILGLSSLSKIKMETKDRSKSKSGRTPSSRCKVSGGANQFSIASFPAEIQNSLIILLIFLKRILHTSEVGESYGDNSRGRCHIHVDIIPFFNVAASILFPHRRKCLLNLVTECISLFCNKFNFNF